MREVKFQRPEHEVLAQADDSFLRIVDGWTLLIPRQHALMYARDYNARDDAGFREREGMVVLTHEGKRMRFTPAETHALLELIRTAFSAPSPRPADRKP
jgi:hypothetical protein